MQDKTKENPTNFTPSGSLGLLFEKAKSHNHFNELLKKELPKELAGLSLCLIENNKVFLAAKNPQLLFEQRSKKINFCQSLTKSMGSLILNCYRSVLMKKILVKLNHFCF